MLGFVVRASGKIVDEHRKIICDDQVILFVCPITVRHAIRLEAEKASVIWPFDQSPFASTICAAFGVGT